MPDDHMLADAIAAIEPEERTPERIFEVIRHVVTETPTAIDEIFPRHRLERKAMPTAERVKIASKAAAERQRQAADERYARVLPIIKDMLEKDPNASLAKIKHRLDSSGLKPLRSNTWSRQAINYIIQREGLRDGDRE